MTETNELPLPTPARPRVALTMKQTVKAAQWMVANADRCIAADDSEIAHELGGVLNTPVTENNVASLREATGLLPREPTAVDNDDIGVLARAVSYLLGGVDVPRELIDTLERIATARGK